MASRPASWSTPARSQPPRHQIRFRPDPQIFGDLQFRPARLYRLCRSKAYLFRGVEIRWACDPVAAAGQRHAGGSRTAFSRRAARQPGGGHQRRRARRAAWSGEADLPARRGHRPDGMGRNLVGGGRGFLHTYCNTVPDAAGRHPRGRLSRSPAQGVSRLGRASRQPPRRPDRRRRHHRRPWRRSFRCSSATRSSRARPRKK